MIYQVLLLSDLVDENTSKPVHKVVRTTETDPNLKIGDKYPVYLDPSSQIPVETEVVNISHLPAEGEFPEEQRIYVEAKDPAAVTAVQDKDARMTEKNINVKHG